MSCVFCTQYKGLKKECHKGTQIETLSESFNCENYTYNGELNDNKSD